MNEDQRDLLEEARDSIAAAKLLLDGGFPGYAASRAYYAMFYAAEVLLEGEGLSFSRHSAVIAAFGQRYAKEGKVPVELHRYLLEAQELRHSGDYGPRGAVSPEAGRQPLERAELFLRAIEDMVGRDCDTKQGES